MQESIYCPRCGERFDENIGYCRTCGLALGAVSEIVRGDAENAPVRSTRPNEAAIRIGIGLFLLGTVIGLAHIVFRDLGLYPQIYGKATLVFFLIAGLLSIGIAYLFPSARFTNKVRPKEVTKSNPEPRKITAPLNQELPSGRPEESISDFLNNSRPEVMAEPDSITEHTTNRLR